MMKRSTMTKNDAPPGSPGGPPLPEQLIDVDAMVTSYHDVSPDPSNSAQHVAFGTSGHRGSAFDGTFNEAHILAITQAIVEYRAKEGIEGPVLMGKDTHGLSRPAERTALEVLAANDIPTQIQANDSITATPVISRAILAYNAERSSALADGIVITQVGTGNIAIGNGRLIELQLPLLGLLLWEHHAGPVADRVAERVAADCLQHLGSIDAS